MSAAPARAGEPRAVIELFTSQGCSSCPPADKLLGELAHDPSLIALSLPVDYWDYLGWKDTLALHGHADPPARLRAARGDREVYTPQVVVNGVVHALGSDKAAIEKAIAQTRAAIRRALTRAGHAESRGRQGDRRRCPTPTSVRRQGAGLALPDHEARSR